jgi:hypothetical protein
MRTKMRERAGRMEEEGGNRRWIELGGRKTCWNKELLTHLWRIVSIADSRRTDGMKTHCYVCWKVSTTEIVRSLGREKFLRGSVEFQRQPARLPEQAVSRVRLPRPWQQTPTRRRLYFSPSDLARR